MLIEALGVVEIDGNLVVGNGSADDIEITADFESVEQISGDMEADSSSRLEAMECAMVSSAQHIRHTLQLGGQSALRKPFALARLEKQLRECSGREENSSLTLPFSTTFSSSLRQSKITIRSSASRNLWTLRSPSTRR